MSGQGLQLLCLLIFSASLSLAMESRCSLPKDPGNCQALVNRFYFNSAKSRCEFFYYGGCGGNSNNFESLSSCHETCPTSSREGRSVHMKSSHCRLAATNNANGYECKGFFPAFTFNAATLNCEKIIYGGCGATQNLYFSLQECLSACTHGELVAQRRSTNEEDSATKSNKGNSLLLSTRSGLNSLRSRMGINNDGGSGGSRSDIVFPGFPAPNEICKLPPIKPGVLACLAFVPKWTYNFRKGACEQYVYGGCRGTANLFDTEQECKRTCGPNQFRGPISTGGSLVSRSRSRDSRPQFCNEGPLKGNTGISCLAYIPKFTFNSEEGKCQDYVYGGCFGSDNLFDSMAECQRVCGPNEDNEHRVHQGIIITNDDDDDHDDDHDDDDSDDDSDEDDDEDHDDEDDEDEDDSDEEIDVVKSSVRTSDVCGLEVDSGRCYGFFTRYAFNSRTQRCEAFVYGGCGGNDNRFETSSDCVSTCGGASSPQLNPLCFSVRCDQRLSDLHFSKGCIPITREGECCPYKWDCDAWESRLQRRDECFLANEQRPGGAYFPVGETDLTEHLVKGANGCLRECKCVRSQSEPAAHIECEKQQCDLFNTEQESHERNESSVVSSCHSIYSSLNSCCPSEHFCETEMNNRDDQLATCVHPEDGNRVFVQGEKMLSTNDPCQYCHCGAEGLLTCQREQCFQEETQLHLINGCTPIYKDNVCCPVSWICPRSDVSLSSSRKSVVLLNEFPCPPGTRAVEENITPLISKLEPLDTRGVDDITVELRAKSEDVCTMPRAEGLCTPGYEKKVFFDASSRRCRRFLFGGGAVGSNDNVFDDYRQCLDTCRRFVRKLGGRPTNNDQVEDSGSIDVRCTSDQLVSEQDSFCAKISVRRFQFDLTTNECRVVFVNSCGLKQTFASLHSCESTCGSSSTASEEKILGQVPLCQLPPKIGLCKSRVKRYYYDTHSGLCKLFHYSGCAGNENNFEHLADCIDTCVPSAKWPRAIEAINSEDVSGIGDVEEVCQLPKKSGQCRAFVPSFYFDSESNTCRFFVYGGCNGNGNRFKSLRQCASTCPIDWSSQRSLRERQCTTPQDIDQDVEQCGNRDERRRSVYFYDNTSKQCRRAQRCLKRIANKQEEMDNQLEVGFRAKVDCVYQCILAAKEEEGNDVDLRQHIFREEREVPLSFVVANDPLVVEHKTLAQEDPCLQPKKVGVCRASIKRFHFSHPHGGCKQFFYGGCDGNANNFATRSECESTCSAHIRAPGFKNVVGLRALSEPRITKSSAAPSTSNPTCSLPLDSGLCLAYMPRYYYDASATKCKRFVFGGCGGNDNNFQSLSECESECGPRDAKGLRQLDEQLSSVRPLLTSDEEARCVAGNDTFAIGDVVKFSEDVCQICRCEAPPALSCVQKTCEPFDVQETNASENCRPVFDDDNCCQTGIQCDEPCDKSACPQFQMPDNANCDVELDDNQCCVISMVCVPNFAPSIGPEEK